MTGDTDDMIDVFEFVDGAWDVPQLYRADPLLFPFFDALKEKRLLGAMTPEGRVLFPPASFCETTYSDVTDLVPVGPGGVIRTFTILPKPPARAIAFVQLDGADTAAAGHLRGVPDEMLYSLDLVGARCRTVFADAPVGDWTDYWFELDT